MNAPVVFDRNCTMNKFTTLSHHILFLCVCSISISLSLSPFLDGVIYMDAATMCLCLQHRCIWINCITLAQQRPYNMRAQYLSISLCIYNYICTPLGCIQCMFYSAQSLIKHIDATNNMYIASSTNQRELLK